MAEVAGDSRGRRLVVVVFDGVSLGIMSFAFGVFDMAKHYGVLPDLDVRVVAGEPAAALSGGGLRCEVPYDLDAIGTADLVIIPDWRDPAEAPPPPLLEALRGAHAAGGRIAGLCSGTFVLAAAGLLDGRPATTHWAMAGLLARMHPKIDVRPEQLYIDDGDVLTAGGGAAGMDLGLHLLRTQYGADVANRLARSMVVPPHRSGGQAQYVETPLPALDRADPVGETLAWALGHLDQALPVDALARRAQMSRRNFDRRFREITGTAPATWLTHQRVLRAQQLLESTRLPVEEGAAVRVLQRRRPPAALQALRRHRSRGLQDHVRAGLNLLRVGEIPAVAAAAEAGRIGPMTTPQGEIRAFRAEIPQDSLDDLRARLNRVRWASEVPGPGPEDYGVGLAWVRKLAEYWRDGYDWRAAEARLNSYPQFVTEIDGQDVHFLRVESREPGAIPLILTHGWPGSVFEYLNVIGPLTDPRAHGKDPSTAFDLVIPSLPGFAFSAPLCGRGWSTQATAAAWAELMRRLGYERYGAVGNDAGSMISPEVGRLDPGHVIAVYVTQVFSFPSGDPAEFEGMSAEDGAAMGKLQWFMDHKISFNQLHSQQPQTLAHALADSPVGLLGWNTQLMTPDAMGDKQLDEDFILTNVALYWLTNTGGSSIRFYYEDAHGTRHAEPTTVPLGVAGFAGDFSGVRRFAERDHKNLVQWNMHPEPGGHYAAHLEPEVLADDIRDFYRGLR